MLTTDDVAAPSTAGGGKRKFCSCGAPFTVWTRDALQFQPVRCSQCGRQFYAKDVKAMLLSGTNRLK